MKVVCTKKQGILHLLTIVGVIFILSSSALMSSAAVNQEKKQSSSEQNRTPSLRNPTAPSFTLNYAGNYSELGGPYWQPPGETQNLTNHSVVQWRNGYFTNDSQQESPGIYINCTISYAPGIRTVWMNWLNGTMWTNRTYEFQRRPGNYWDIDTSVRNIPTSPGNRYSFDVVVNGQDGLFWTYPWNKTVMGSTQITPQYTRRYVSLHNEQRDTITYIPYYLNGILYTFVDINKCDRLHHDQGTDGSPWGSDTGFLMSDIPGQGMKYLHCTQAGGSWFDESVCIPTFTLRNIYAHVWWSSLNPPNSKYAYSRSRGVLSLQAEQYFYLVNYPVASRFFYHLDIDGVTSDNYALTPAFLDINDLELTSNNIYEFTFDVFGGDIVVLNNRSLTSFILFNVPDNDSLNTTDWTLQGGGIGDHDGDGLSDWTELYTSYTNPFLTDTDNDGIADTAEWINDHTDPNNFSDYLVPGGHQVTLAGDCFYPDGSPPHYVSVEIINTNLHKQWKVTTTSNHYQFSLRSGQQISAGDILRFIIKDTDESANVTEHTVTAEEIATGALYQDFIIRDHFRDLLSFPLYYSLEDTGAAIMKMMLDYCLWNSTAVPQGPPNLYNEHTLYLRYNGWHSMNISGEELSRGLNTEIDDRNATPPWKYGYFFSPDGHTSADQALLSAAIWLDYNISGSNNHRTIPVPSPGYPYHTPVAIPTGGTYEDWMVIRGLYTNRSLWNTTIPGDHHLRTGPVTIYGFWINDPNYRGIGNDVYVTYQYFNHTYFKNLSGVPPEDPFYRTYLVIVDPPQEIPASDIHDITVNTVCPQGFSEKEMRLLRTTPGDKIIEKKALDFVRNIIQYNSLYGPHSDNLRVLSKPQQSNSGYLVTLFNEDMVVRVLLSPDGVGQQFSVKWTPSH
jgi:hypothetical protein